jgi:hypothetical protein
MGNMFAEAKRRADEQRAAGTFLDKGASKKQARADWDASFYGKGGTTPLSQFQNTKLNRYAMNNVGWDKAQANRRAAEAADVGAVSPDGKGGNRWERRFNHVTGEMEWLEKEDSNYWKANKNELIQMGAMTLGGLLLGPGGMMLGKSLADTGRNIKVARDVRRDIQHDKRQWEYEEGQEAAAQEAARRANMGNLFRSGGEGVVEYATKNLAGKKRDQYVRQPYSSGVTA